MYSRYVCAKALSRRHDRQMHRGNTERLNIHRTKTILRFGDKHPLHRGRFGQNGKEKQTMTEAYRAAIKAQKREYHPEKRGVVTRETVGDSMTKVTVKYSRSVGLSAENLIRNHGFLIAPSTTENRGLKLYNHE